MATVTIEDIKNSITAFTNDLEQQPITALSDAWKIAHTMSKNYKVNSEEYKLLMDFSAVAEKQSKKINKAAKQEEVIEEHVNEVPDLWEEKSVEDEEE